MRAGLVAALLATAVALGGCAPGPSPKPTPTPLFTSEADAFKAAEQVYREYVDVGNAEQNGDKSATPQKYLAGTALNDDVETRRKFEAQGLSFSGSLEILSFHGDLYDRKTSGVDASVCVGVGTTRVLDRSGNDVTPAKRPPVVALNLRFDAFNGRLLITKSETSSAKCPTSKQ